MTTRPPAEIGMTLDEVDTPALIVDLDAFERNLKRLADRVAGRGVRLRPHAKTHKCPVIALKQVELGAVGVCVQKVSEAEAMVYGGVRDVLVTNEIVGRQKLRRLMGLAHTAAYRGVRRRPGADRRSRRRRRRGRGREPPGACRDQHGRQSLRRRAGRAGARSGAPYRRLAASALRRIAGLSRLGAASARLGRAAEGDRRRGREGGDDARPAERQRHRHATTSPAPAPARSSSRPAAASIPNCNAARTSSWTPITAAISTMTAG